ncbi:hypothetical protein [Thiobacter aerophilum]|uniref:Uncharacterized protein n=1 Tax=Thiobacter aerophilum TaxID=3121275 RepID=A0ABV0EAY1_9BURK
MHQDRTECPVAVSVAEGEEGERVRVDFGGTVLHLTPQEARALASQLIQTVYQAEVKASLRRREARDLSPASRRIVEGHFPGLRPSPARQ